MTRLQRRLAVVILALAALAVIGAGGARIATASNPPPCPPGANCLPNPAIITDHATGMGAPLLIEDNEGKPPGLNAVMFWVDGFQVGSVNPVCADATSPYLAREACLGGPPFDATGGHPVLALWDGRRWQVLTAGDIALLNALRMTGLTSADLRMLAMWAHAREARR